MFMLNTPYPKLNYSSPPPPQSHLLLPLHHPALPTGKPINVANWPRSSRTPSHPLSSCHFQLLNILNPSPTTIKGHMSLFSHISKPMVLNQVTVPPGDIWQSLQTFFVNTGGGMLLASSGYRSAVEHPTVLSTVSHRGEWSDPRCH